MTSQQTGKDRVSLAAGRVAAGMDTPAGELDAVTTLEALSGIGGALYSWDIASDRLEWTANAAALFGIESPAEIGTGRDFARFLDPSGPAGRYESVFESGSRDGGEGVPYLTEYRFLSPGADTRQAMWVEDCGRWYAGPDGQPLRAHGIVRLLRGGGSERAELRFRSDHDTLTGGFNRSRLTEELSAAIDRAQKRNSSAALVIAAVNSLGAVNDAFGFTTGDEAVAGVAERLSDRMRAGDALGRLAGNKIGVVLNDCSEADLRVAAERFSLAVSEEPIETSSGPVAVTVSMGGVLMPRHAATASDALARAQEALSSARRRRTSNLALYDPSPAREAQRQRNVAIAKEVVEALNAGRVALAFQPIVSAKSAEPVLHEGLCRLSTEAGEPIHPGDFIETVERLGVIRLIDNCALDLAVNALLDSPELSLSINVSTASAMDGTWFARLAAHVRNNRHLPDRLTIEITETMAIADMARAIDFVQSLRDLGCRVAIDDFGAGHTSFRNLRALEADLVKIDGSFVENIGNNPDDVAFVSALVGLARHMGLQTVAEKVTTESDAEMLRGIGIDYLQGHFFGRAEAEPLQTTARSRVGSAVGQ